jgi:hypothetical protein
MLTYSRKPKAQISVENIQKTLSCYFKMYGKFKRYTKIISLKITEKKIALLKRNRLKLNFISKKCCK